MKRHIVCVLLVACAAAFCFAAGKEEAAAPVSIKGVVLNNHSFWRCHVTLRPIVEGTAAAPKPGGCSSTTW